MCHNIVQYYSDDVDENLLVTECIQLKSCLPQPKSECYTSEIYKLLYEKKFLVYFQIATQLKKFFLMFSITSCEAECSFSRMSYWK